MMAGSTYSISQVSTKLGASTRTLRYYEERGLLRPGRSKGGSRRFNDRDFARLKAILRAKRFGFTLTELKGVLTYLNGEGGEPDQSHELLRKLKTKLSRLKSDRVELTETITELESTCGELEQELGKRNS